MAALSFAQNRDLARVSGTVVVDMYDGKMFPVADAAVGISSGGSDTLWTVTGRTGSFALKTITVGKHAIHLRKMGMKPYDGSLELAKGKNVLILKMERAVYSLDSATVSADMPLLTHQGDTVIVHPEAVYLSADDAVIELFKAVPGVTVKGGKMYVNGERVERIYVNGRFLYGSNPMDAANNLMASEVTEIKIYDEPRRNDVRRGYRNPKKEKVADIRTREPIIQAFDGYAVASGGIDGDKDASGRLKGRYLAGGSAKFFSEKLLLRSDLLANNVGKKQYSRSDLSSVGDPIHSNENTIHAGVGAVKYLDGIWDFLQLGYDWQGGKIDQRTLRQEEVYAEAGFPSMHRYDTSGFKSGSSSHAIQFKFHKNETPLTDIALDASFMVKSTDEQSYQKEALWTGGVLSGRTALDNDSHRRAWKASLAFKTTDNRQVKFHPESELSLGLGWDNASQMLADTLETSFTRRKMTSSPHGMNLDSRWRIAVSGTVVNTDKYTLSIAPEVYAGYVRDKRVNVAYDLLDVVVPTLNLLQTYQVSRSNLSAGAGASVMIQCANHVSITAETTLGATMLSDQSGHTRWFFSPQAVFSYSTRRSWLPLLQAELVYDVPAVEQSLGIFDDRNPIALQCGNPALKPTGNISVYATLFRKNKRGKYLNINATANVKAHPVGSSRRYFPIDTVLPEWNDYTAKAGSVLYSWMNLGPEYRAGLDAYATSSLKRKLSYGFKLVPKWQISSRESLLGGERVRYFESNPSLLASFTLTTPGKVFSTQIDSQTSYSDIAAADGKMAVRTLSEVLGISAGLTFKHWFARSSFTWDYMHFPGGELPDRHAVPLGALIGYRRGRLMISLSGNDLLSRGLSYSVVTDANATVQSWTPSFGRYFMLSVYWRLNKTDKRSIFKGASFDSIGF